MGASRNFFKRKEAAVSNEVVMGVGYVTDQPVGESMERKIPSRVRGGAPPENEFVAFLTSQMTSGQVLVE